MTPSTQWAWVWADAGRDWRTGKPGVLQSTGPQRVGHNWATEQQQQQRGSGSQSPTAQTWNTDLESGRHAGSPKADLGCCGRLRRRSRPLQLRSQWPSNAVSRKSDSGSARSNMHAHSQSLFSCDLQPVWEVGKGRVRSGAVRASLQLRQCLQKQAAGWAKDSSEASDGQQTTYTQRQTETFHRTVSFEK